MNNLSEFLSTLYGTMNNTMSGIATGFDIYKQEKQRKDYNILNSDYEKFQKIIDLTDSTNRNFTDDNSFIQSMSENGIDESYSKAFLDYVGYDFNNKDIKLETYITSKGLGTESWKMKKLEEANYQQEMNKVLSFVSEKYANYTQNRIKNNSGVINLSSFGDVKEGFQDFSSQINSESISQATGINKETVDRILEDEKYIEQETNWYNTYFRNVIEPISKAEVEAKTITNAQTSSYEVLYSCLNNGMDLYSTLDAVNSALNSSGIDYVSDKTQRNKIFWNTVNIAVDEKYKQFGRDNWQLSDEEFSSKLNQELETDYKKLYTKYGEDLKSKLLSTFNTNKTNAVSNYKGEIETAQKARNATINTLESTISTNSQRLLDENDSSLINMTDDDKIKYITSDQFQTVEDFEKNATPEMLYWFSIIKNKSNEKEAYYLTIPYKESIALSAQNARTKYEYLDTRTDAYLTFENGKYVFKKSEDGDNVMWNDSKFDVFKIESQSTDTKNNTPEDDSFIHVTAYEDFNEYLINSLGSDSSKWDADTVKALSKAWNNSFQEALTTEELQKETKGIVESKIYQLAMSGDLETAKKLVEQFAYSSNPYWTPQEANTIKRNLDYAVRDEVKDIFNTVDETIKNLNLPSKAILEGRFTIPLEKLVYYSDKYTKGEMTIDEIKNEVVNTTIDKFNLEQIKDSEKELNNISSNLNLSSYPSSTDIGENANILGYGYDIVRNLASGNPIIGSLTEEEFNTIFASMQGYDSKTTYENLNDIVSQALYGCNYSEIDKLKKDDKKNTDTDILKTVVIKNSSGLVYMDKKIERLEWSADIVLSDYKDENGNKIYSLKPVFFNGDVAIFCPQNGTIYSIPDNTNTFNVFAYTVQPKYISNIEMATNSGTIPLISNDLLHKDNNGFKIELLNLYGNAFNK